MFLAEIAAIRNDLGLRCLCKATPEKVKSAHDKNGGKQKLSKIAILIYYQVREHVSSCKLTFAFCIKALCLEVQCTMES